MADHSLHRALCISIVNIRVRCWDGWDSFQGWGMSLACTHAQLGIVLTLCPAELHVCVSVSELSVLVCRFIDPLPSQNLAVSYLCFTGFTKSNGSVLIINYNRYKCSLLCFCMFRVALSLLFYRGIQVIMSHGIYTTLQVRL